MCDDVSDLDPTTETGILNIATGGLYGATKDPISDAFDKVSGKDAADDAAAAIEAAAQTQSDFQNRGLDYLIETEETPQALRQAGLQQLGGIAGLPGFEEYGSQQGLIDQAQASPLYQSILGTGAAGSEALARTQSATGGLRGGGTASQLADYNQNLSQEALLSSYNQQLGNLQGLAQLPSAAPQISQQYGQIGQTQAQGQIAAAQAQQQQNNNLMNLGGQLGAAYLMSDVRLKDNIVKTGSTSNPEIFTYSWDWLPISGKTGSDTGFLAQEVEKVYPEFVIDGDDGFKRIHKENIETKLKELN